MPKDVLALGRALVKELGLDPGEDTLSRWMAHYIAELIKDAETASVEDRPEKLAKCADAILALWKHRHQLPNGNRPFEDLGPILRALKSLDPSDKTPRYFRAVRNAVDESEESPETRKWLELADALDYSAKLLISYCLTQASHTALDSSRDWVALAEAAGLDDGLDFTVLRIIYDENKLMQSNPEAKQRKQLEDRVKRLDDFKARAEALASNLRKLLMQSQIDAVDSKDHRKK
ncbi:AVAST type 3 anti-phage proein Avs3b [Geobacter anodireducens]